MRKEMNNLVEKKKKMFTYVLNMGLPSRAWVETTFPWVETYCHSLKENVPIKTVSKKVPYVNPLWHERTDLYRFL